MSYGNVALNEVHYARFKSPSLQFRSSCLKYFTIPKYHKSKFFYLPIYKYSFFSLLISMKSEKRKNNKKKILFEEKKLSFGRNRWTEISEIKNEAVFFVKVNGYNLSFQKKTLPLKIPDILDVWIIRYYIWYANSVTHHKKKYFLHEPYLKISTISYTNKKYLSKFWERNR